MRDGTPDKDRMQHPGKCEIGDELPLSGQQAAILAPWHRASNEAGQSMVCHLSSPLGDGHQATVLAYLPSCCRMNLDCVRGRPAAADQPLTGSRPIWISTSP